MKSFAFSMVLEAESCADDPFYFWLLSEQVVDQVPQAQHDPEVLQVRTVEMWEEEKEWIVLDSGADVSLLPRRCAAGYDIPSPQVQLEDAQGNPLDIGGMRQVEVEFEHCLNDDIGCCLNEAFIVSSRTSFYPSVGCCGEDGPFQVCARRIGTFSKRPVEDSVLAS